jgi:hypothetical protein
LNQNVMCIFLYLKMIFVIDGLWEEVCRVVRKLK